MTDSAITDSAAVFDAVAASYDETFEDNPITRHIRAIIGQTLTMHFQRGERIIDINCGTGTDAVALAGRGIRVAAIDASPRMIEMTRLKCSAENLSNLVEANVMRYEDLHSLEEKSYDGALSNFGGLNCTPELEPIAQNISRLLKPGSVFVACVMNRFCLWEIGAYLGRGNVRQAFRRFHRDGIQARLGDQTMRIYYYSPREFARRISRWFAVERIYGISILSPSPNSRSFFTNNKSLSSGLMRIDDRIRARFPAYALGDHFVIEARRLPR
jgi:ubiquinone/menaquinone biosynthesis C-methylase UbiE